MKNIINLWKRLHKKGAILKYGDTEKAVSPIYSENAMQALWLAFFSSNYVDV